jgi:hypothetical protein
MAKDLISVAVVLFYLKAGKLYKFKIIDISKRNSEKTSFKTIHLIVFLSDFWGLNFIFLFPCKFQIIVEKF